MTGDGVVHLSPGHRQQLEVGSGIPPEMILSRRYETITTKAELKRRGFGDRQLNVPALLIPLWNVHGELAGYQCKPERPRMRDGKPLKYETPAGMKMVIDVPPAVRHMLGNPAIPLFITEGVKKVDRAAADGLCCIGLLGVWNWRGSNDDGGLTALADWESIALKGRVVIIAFDSDVTTKQAVLAAMRRLREFLKTRGATVRICLLPPGPHAEKTGLDDFFVRGGTVQGLMACVQDDLPQLAEADVEREYEELKNGLYWLRPTQDGVLPVRLCDFVALITREVSKDDGVDLTRVLELEVRIGDDTQHIQVPIEKFGTPNWHLQYLGIRARVHPGTTPQRLVHAIQTLSTPVTTKTYAHTGWRKIGDYYYFLNGGPPIGPIGPHGPLPELEVELPPQVGMCVFPCPPTGEALCRSSMAMLDVLEVSSITITLPLMVSVIRAVIGNADFSVFVFGTTGVRKTALVAIFQSFVGAQFDARHLPGNWSSTANAIEELLFTAKDLPVTIDDYVPAHAGERGALDAKADRVFRGSANGSGRQRLRPDGSPRPEHPSRGLPIATGEMLPANVSVLARVLAIEIKKGSVNLQRLTKLQKDAADGKLVLAMSGFLQWLAPRLEEIREELKQRTEALRRELQRDDYHGRTIHVTAELLATAEILADFLIYAKAIEPNDRTGFLADARAALLACSEAQNQVISESDPVDQFIHLLVSALASGRAHLCSAATGDGPPRDFEQLTGWFHSGDHASSPYPWIARGHRIGWLSSKGDVYLIPEAADAVVQQLARDQGDSLIVGTALRKRLKERGLLASTDQRGGAVRLVVRKMIGKIRHDVLHLHAQALWLDAPSCGEVAQVAQSDVSNESTTGSGGPSGDPGGQTPAGIGPSATGGAP